MADPNICRVETDSLENAAGDIEKEKPALDGVRVEIGGITLPANAFGRVDQSARAARSHAAAVAQVTQELGTLSGEITKLATYLRAWKDKYETDTKRAVECLVNLRKLRPLTPTQPTIPGQY